MAKPRAIQWLEEQTGERIDFEPEAEPPRERHLSVRVSAELAARSESAAVARGLTLSELIRRLLTDMVDQQDAVADLDGRALADRLAADVAEVRRRLAG